MLHFARPNAHQDHQSTAKGKAVCDDLPHALLVLPLDDTVEVTHTLRMLLGHARCSPAPSCLTCVGWIPWSFHAARLSLLHRSAQKLRKLLADLYNALAQLFPAAKLVPGT